ncbi:hypothetical protein LWI29_006625 [Acer saccharum]|uniref:Retrovirus-related Pol polyprotein from transposon TNT 1-94-like beta-barrel domain-containing protein n=1 Tax=Acer saccharum TaxID=4024 RepID=A0AA39SD97_ACESA|nr:hypothetical protein LWI29_006625 [Acer saccharum]
MMSSITDALMCENEGFNTAQDMWITLKDKFGGTSTTKLRRLTIKFDTYRKRQNHDMRQHLREMSNMIRELKSAGHSLTDEHSVLLTESRPLWTVDSGAIDHVARDRATFVEYRRISQGTRWIYVGNSSRVKVKGIGTCKLMMHSGQVLYLHDNLYATGIRRNLVSVIVLLGTSVPSGSETPLEVNIDLPGPSVPSGSNDVIETTLLDLPSRISNRGNVPHRRLEIEGEAFMVVSHDTDEPKNVNEALKSLDKELWIKAMKEEMDSMKSNHVWDLVDLPLGRKAIGNKWVL